MKAYTACLFDLYGTLVDIHTDESKPAFWNKVAAWYTEHGAAWTGKTLRSEYLRLCGEAEAKLLAEAPSGAHVEPDLQDVFAALYRLRGVDPDAGLIDETARVFRRASTTHLRAYAGARELLCGIREKKIPVILLSNAQSCFTRPELFYKLCMGICNVFYYGVFLAALAGLWRLLKSRAKDAGLLLPLFFLGLTLAHMLVEVSDRYHYSLIPILILVALELLFSGLMLKSSLFSRLISGTPIVVVSKGKLDQKALKKLRLTSEDLMESLRMAARSGIDVRIMIPCMPDHPFVYRTTLYNAGKLIDDGARIYIYENGFLHAKTLSVDGEVCTVGSANFDIRSFRLNFESNAFIYDKDVTADLDSHFISDIELSRPYTREDRDNISLYEKAAESISRLLTEIL